MNSWSLFIYYSYKHYSPDQESMCKINWILLASQYIPSANILSASSSLSAMDKLIKIFTSILRYHFSLKRTEILWFPMIDTVYSFFINTFVAVFNGSGNSFDSNTESSGKWKRTCVLLNITTCISNVSFQMYIIKWY